MFNKSITLKASSPYLQILDYLPITEAKEQIPEWSNTLKGIQRIPVVDQTPEMYEFFSSAKFCPAINDMLNTGYILRMWCDCEIRVFPDGRTQYAFSGPFKASSHSSLQYEGIIKGFANVKLESPWHFATNKHVSFYWTSPFYHSSYFEQNNIVVMPGLLDFYYNHITNVNLLFPIKDNEYTVIIKAGQPLVHIIPLTKEKITLKHDKISFDDFHTSTFNLKFYGVNSFKKKHLSKCPFSFLHKKKN